MHDLHEANKIIKLVLKKAKENNLRKVTKIDLELGVMIEHGQTIKPENLRFNLELLGKNTPAEGAKIIIKETRGDHWELKEIEGKK